MDKTLNYLALARKAGLAELGEEPVGAITRALKGHLVLVASDASDHTWRRAKSFVAGTDQQCVRLPYTKAEVGFAIGRQELAIAAITDAGMALSIVESLGQPERHKEVIEVLTAKKQKALQRQKENKAHARNVRFGKKK
jgi:ribosomal protein L7Ae-like RNA K-turn-binding protein